MGDGGEVRRERGRKEAGCRPSIRFLASRAKLIRRPPDLSRIKRIIFKLVLNKILQSFRRAGGGGGGGCIANGKFIVELAEDESERFHRLGRFRIKSRDVLITSPTSWTK